MESSRCPFVVVSIQISILYLFSREFLKSSCRDTCQRNCRNRDKSDNIKREITFGNIGSELIITSSKNTSMVKITSFGLYIIYVAVALRSAQLRSESHGILRQKALLVGTGEDFSPQSLDSGASSRSSTPRIDLGC